MLKFNSVVGVSLFFEKIIAKFIDFDIVFCSNAFIIKC